MTGVVIAIFALWALASVLVLVPRFSPWIRAYDLFGWVPEWKFFAPIPGRGDFHLLYRDTYPEGMSEWTELLLGGPRRPWNCLWHPGRRERKAAFDASREISRHLSPDLIDTIHVTIPYLAMLNHVSELPRMLPAVRTQFTLMYSESMVEQGVPSVSVVSHLHELHES